MAKEYVLILASVGALVALSAATFLCSWRRRRAPSPSQRRAAAGDVELGHGAPHGIDEAVLAGYPTLVYSSSSPAPEKDEEETAAEPVPAEGGPAAGSDAARCAVCLADYADGDELRLLPDCRHAFHRGCIDQWLRRRPTCPVCRASPPQPQPLGKAPAASVAVVVAAADGS